MSQELTLEGQTDEGEDELFDQTLSPIPPTLSPEENARQILGAAQTPARRPGTTPIPQATSRDQTAVLLEMTPADAQFVTFRSAELSIKVLARKVALADDSVGVILDGTQCDISPVISTKYYIDIGDEQLRILYVGGKVEFGDFIVLTFIRDADT